MQFPWSLARPPGTFEKLAPMEGGEEGRLPRDLGQPIWMLLTWPPGPSDSPPPRSIREGRGWGLSPLPQRRFSFLAGGVTPRITFSPRTKPRGTLDTPGRFQESGKKGPLDGDVVINVLNQWWGLREGRSWGSE